MKIEFRVPGKPVGKGRPRFTRTGHTYTPKATTEYEQRVWAAYLEKSHGAKLHGNLYLDITAYLPIPQSASKKQQEFLEGKLCQKKPDADNICKSIMDALNGVAYEDDRQIVSVTIEKRQSITPRVDVRIAEYRTVE